MSIETREKNVKRSRTFKNILELYGLSSKSVLDIGCGFGEYLRLFGKGSIGITTTTNEIDYGRTNNLPIILGNAENLDELDFKVKFDAFWANNLFEHLLSPHSFLMKLKKFSTRESTLVLGVPVLPKIIFLTKLSKFRGALASNHINFFIAETLKFTVERSGWKIITVRPFVFKNAFLDQIIRPIVPHLYVVAKNDTSFAYPTKKVGEWKDDDKYIDLLSITNQNAG